MKDEQLLNFFEIHKDGLIEITHPIIPGTFEHINIADRQLHVSITLEDLYRMFELVRERRENAVTQD